MPTTAAAELLAGEVLITAVEGPVVVDPTAPAEEGAIPAEEAALTVVAAVTRTANPRF